MGDDSRDGKPRISAQIRWAGRDACGDDGRTEHRDHRAIVGAQSRTWPTNLEAGSCRTFFEQPAQPRIGRYSPAQHNRLNAILASRVNRLGRQHISDSLLEGRRDISDRNLLPVSFELINMPGDGRLEPGK